MKKRKFLFLITLLLTLSSFITANAEIFGGKWTSNPTYYVDSSNVYSFQINNAISYWNSALSSIGSSIHLSSSTVTSAVIIPNSEYYGAVEWIGWGQPGPDAFDGTYEYALIKYNRTRLDPISSPGAKQAIISHEWGHALGLHHTVGDETRSLMSYRGYEVYYNQWGITMPTAYDKSSLDLIY